MSKHTPSRSPDHHNPVNSTWGREPYPQEMISPTPPALTLGDDGYITTDCAEKLFRFHPEVVLYCPEIPQNTGSISRLCAAMSAPLHLIKPMKFDITEKKVRRAGLDYWEHVRLSTHDSWDAFVQTRQNRRFVFVETGGTQSPASFSFEPGDVLVFGGETGGIPCGIMEETKARARTELITIPMFNRGVRSLNLANTVSIVLYAAIARLHKNGAPDEDFSHSGYRAPQNVL
jgi:tRNA (cytidine/uridine-2'-O-)-methyltransferase